MKTPGFTLIELVITIAIAAILIFAALPSFTAWIQNTQIRTAGEGILSGLQLARTEALRRNTNVELRMDAASGWTVSLPGTGEVVQTRIAQEGSTNATVIASPAGADKVTFSGFGRVTGNNDGTAVITDIRIDNLTIPAADRRRLCIVVSGAGVVRLCDPQVAAGDPRACVPVPAGCV